MPTQLHRALNGDQQLLEHLMNAKAVLVGAAATPRELLNAAGMAGINVVRSYGMTEMSPVSNIRCGLYYTCFIEFFLY